MIESGRITSRFSIDIHPGRKISKQIQHLTGITNQRVQKAPYFEDVAQTIYNLWQTPYLSRIIFILIIIF